jgi:hypothetical protein
MGTRHINRNGPQMRECRLCGATFDEDKFGNVHSGYKDSYCKNCRKAYMKGYRKGVTRGEKLL